MRFILYDRIIINKVIIYMHEVDDIMLMTDEKEKMMNKKVAKKNYVFYAKRVLGEVLRLEANSTSCTLFYEPKQPENIAKFKRKTK